MFYDNKEDLINEGMLNKQGEEDEIIGYASYHCMNCGRTRVEQYVSGKLVCEKCDFDQNTGEIVNDKYYSNF